MSNGQTSERLAKKIREWSLQLIHAGGASHVGGSLSVADILAVLYSRILRFDARRPDWPDRDRLYYSKGHACAALYAALMECGFIDEATLRTFSKEGSALTTHINHKVPGVELSTGSLGHALSVACGAALAGKRQRRSHRVFAILSDGELDEGSNWEAILFAPHHQLNRLCVIVDYNKVQSLGNVVEVLDLDSLADKFRAFRWQVKEIDGHDHEALYSALAETDSTSPTVVIAHTVKGKGVDFMEGRLLWHYRTPSAEQLEDALKQIREKS